MSSQIKPLKLWTLGGPTPNPRKIEILFEELNLPHESVPVTFANIKGPEHTAVNPNGRTPSLQDPNTGLDVFESGSILEYLVERYDKDHKVSFPAGSDDAARARSWLHYQMSGQGPYYGQAVWFRKYHPEKVASAAKRYSDEIKRVTGVLEGHLAKQTVAAGEDGPWIVGGKFSFVDIAWFPWQYRVHLFLTKDEFDPEEYPNVNKWLANLNARESIKKTEPAQ